MLGRVRAPPRSPTSKLLRSPPTPSSPSAAAPVPLADGLPPGANACSCRVDRLPVRAPADPRALEIDYRFSIRPELSRGETRASQVTGPSSSYVPWCNTSPDAILYSPTLLFEKICAEVAIAFTKNRMLGIRNDIVFEASYPRPTRLCAYASPITLPQPSQGSLPARAGSPLAGRVSHPLDD